VEVESESGRGTTFRLYLPLAADGSPTRADDPETAAPEAGSGRILLVDDEETVRCVAKEFLIQLGYEVTTARDGQEALQIYRRAPTDFRLVILDLVMPRLGGRETFRALRAINPNVRALLSTGYDFDDSARDLLNEGMAGFIQKPYRIADLSAAVNRALRS
jgi:CheY-like chemotaxis protein